MTARPSAFSPRAEDVSKLLERTVCRDDLIERVSAGLSDSVASGQARFDLVVGPRGAGKSHLLGVLHHSLRQRLPEAVSVVAVDEDFHPASLIHLLGYVLQRLSDPEMFVWQRAVLQGAGSDAVPRAAEMIRLAASDGPIVLLIENLDTVLRAIGARGQKQLRRVLQTHARWSILATARELAPAFIKESEPFYGTFVEHRLPPLSVGCCREMLVALAKQTQRTSLVEYLQSSEGLAQVEALRHVLGGYPRAMALIFGCLGEEPPVDLEASIDALGEELTPYFQEQLARLSPGQRPVAEILAEAWRPLSVGEIAESTFTPSATTSTHLRHLRRDGLVVHTKLGREVYYELADPLFRISRAMKTQRLRATTLLRILRAWYGAAHTSRWRFEDEASGELWIRIRHAESDELGQYHKEQFERFWRAFLSGDRAKAASRLARDLSKRPDPFLTGLLAFAYAASNERGRALDLLEALPAADAIEAMGSMRTLRELTPWAAVPTTVRVVSLALDLFVRPEEVDESEIADVLRAEGNHREARLVHSVFGFIFPARSGRYGLCAALLAAVDTTVNDWVRLDLSIALGIAWFSGKLHEFCGSQPQVFAAAAERAGPDLALILRHAQRLVAGSSGEARPWVWNAEQWDDLAMADWRTGLLPTVAPLAFEVEVGTAVAGPSDSMQFEAPPMVLAAGLYGWIASGRPMAQVNEVARQLHQYAPVVPLEVLTAPDWRSAYARLPEAGRAVVRTLAAHSGAGDRLAELNKIAPGRDE